MTGVLCISLDFELMWGVLDCEGREKYKRKNIRHTKNVIPEILKVFREYEIHATWATVGFLFYKNKDDLVAGIKDDMEPINYDDHGLDPYHVISHINTNIDNDNYFANDLISEINSESNQEIASHTFCHYYTNESGQTIDSFRNDLEKFSNLPIKVNSIVFPRNQINPDAIKECYSYGYSAYRGHYSSKAKTSRYIDELLESDSKLAKILRFTDSFINISGNHTILPVYEYGLVNIKGCRFLRPVADKPLLRKLHVGRIKNEINAAAKNNEIYHLWWHPHNFGENIQESINMLREILDLYKELKIKGEMISLNMSEITNRLNRKESGFNNVRL